MGTVFYAFCDKNFGWLYSFFYATNVGLSVGFTEQKRISDDLTKYATMVYVMVGSSMVTSSLGVLVASIGERAKRAGTLGDSRSLLIISGELKISFLFYVAALAFGLFTAKYQHFDSTADTLLFVIGNYTTLGLISPKNNFGSHFWTAISLFVGIPANFFFMANLSAALGRAVYGKATEEDDDLSGGNDDHESYQVFLEEELLRSKTYTTADLKVARDKYLQRRHNHHQRRPIPKKEGAVVDLVVVKEEENF